MALLTIGGSGGGPMEEGREGRGGQTEVGEILFDSVML